jgi:hypothetical protein
MCSQATAPGIMNIVNGVRKIEPTKVSIIVKPFHETQRLAECALHAIHNLLRDSSISKTDMHTAATECVKESGDSLGNHESPGGYWSVDTLVRCLEKHGYKAIRGVKTFKEQGKTVYKWYVNTMYELLDDDTVIGFIIHEKNHYTSLRKNGANWEYSNSMHRRPVEMSPYNFCELALNGSWNIFLVSKLSI